MGKISEHDARELVKKQLENFADIMGLTYYPYSNRMGGQVDEDLLPFQENQTEVDEVAENFKLLLDYLGLEIQTGKRIVKKTKKAKK